MKKLSYFLVVFLLTLNGYAQQAEVVVFKHDLRWVDETKFPNYFQLQDVRDAVFKTAEQEIGNYLKLTAVNLPENVNYNIINGFGKQKITMPNTASASDYEVGIFSFITRATVGLAVFWKLTVVIKEKGKIILNKEIVHELEYFNASGYLTNVQWLDSDKFEEILIRLLKEALGVLPASNEVIVIGSVEELEAKAQALLAEPSRHILKIDGNWRYADNFVAQMESPQDTVLGFRFKDKFIWEFPKPSFSDFMAPLFTQMTGIGVEYDKMVKRQKKATIVFADKEEIGILLKWIEIETNSTLSDEVYSRRVDNPLVAELYSKDQQVGYFIYVQEEFAYTTDKTESSFNIFNGDQIKNSLGVETIHRIEGKLYDKPIVVEYNDNTGIIEVFSGEDRLCVMVIQNINPDNQSISDERLSKNKKFITSGKMGKPTLKKVSSQEWYPIYFSKNFSSETGKMGVEALFLLFFGMGNM